MTADRGEQLEALLPKLLRRMFADAGDGELSHLSLPQLRILRLLLEGPRNAGEVADLLGISPSALSQLTHRLAQAGLLQKTKDEEDARIKRLSLTPKATVLMEARRTERAQRAQTVLSKLPECDQVKLVQLLEKLTSASSPESWTSPLERITS